MSQATQIARICCAKLSFRDSKLLLSELSSIELATYEGGRPWNQILKAVRLQDCHLMILS